MVRYGDKLLLLRRNHDLSKIDVYVHHGLNKDDVLKFVNPMSFGVVLDTMRTHELECVCILPDDELESVIEYVCVLHDDELESFLVFLVLVDVRYYQLLADFGDFEDM